MGSLSLLICAALILGYLLGSIPFGLLLTRSAGLGDVRNIGSGNIGATNVLRTGSKALAAATLLCDMLKGTAAVILAVVIATHVFQMPPSVAYTAGIASGLGAFLGHLYPLWLKFKGGKGVATYIGVLLGVAPPLAAGFCLIWLAVALASRYSSLAALIAAVATPVLALLLPKLALVRQGPSILFLVLVAMTALLVWKHRENIARLRGGKESKIGQHG